MSYEIKEIWRNGKTFSKCLWSHMIFYHPIKNHQSNLTTPKECVIVMRGFHNRFNFPFKACWTIGLNLTVLWWDYLSLKVFLSYFNFQVFVLRWNFCQKKMRHRFSFPENSQLIFPLNLVISKSKISFNTNLHFLSSVFWQLIVQ